MKKKKDNGLKAVIWLAVATIVVGGASIAVSKMEHAGSTVLDVTGASSKIKEARQNADGTYTVVVSEDGYVGEMIIEATYSADGQTLVSYDVTSSTETENIGTKVDEDAYKAVLAGVKLPVTANGLDISGILGIEQEKASAAGELKDGVYKAQAEPDEKGNYGFVTVTVADGKVTSVVWDEMYGGASKAELAATGQYVMVEGNPTWKDQSESLGAYVVANQTTEGILNEKGYTDAVSGVSIYVGGFVDLTNQAMAQASATVVLKDGEYKAQAEPDEKGNYGFVTVTVADGKVTSVVWDEMYGGASKAELAATGQYVMVEGNPTWKDQSESLGAYVVANQTTEGILNEKGYTDAVSGVSIYVGGFVGLTNEAMAQAVVNGEVVNMAPAIDATTVDVVSGATFSSKAVLRAIDEGFVYLRDFIFNK
ncbi:MAG: FMN-binding protein [Lachnospiraceae bacterium]|nr:FMN-binding protein [Lachnospiraceae bacterium]